MKMIEIEFEPLQQWPRAKTKNPKRARFRTGKLKTDDELRYELAKIGAKNVVIQIALSRDQFKLNGLPRSDSVPSFPGVILAFQMKNGNPVSFPCDTFDHWQDNLRAIVLSLQALRTVDRYGVTKRGEQYTGWAQLPGPAAEEMPFANASEAAVWLSNQATTVADTTGEAILASPRELDFVRRELAKILHPDKGGDENLFKLMEKAAAMVESYQRNKG